MDNSIGSRRRHSLASTFQLEVEEFVDLLKVNKSGLDILFDFIVKMWISSS